MRGWYQIASHLHMTVQEAQAKITSSEFAEWIAYLELEINAFNTQNYYLAQIAAEVRRGHVEHPEKVKVEDLLMKFKFEGDKQKVLDPETRAAQSKSFWKAAVGYTKPKE